MSVLTKKALVEAFGRVLEKKPFSKISVVDITNECSVNRMTFYYHFKDIYDLLEWSLEKQLEDAIDDKFTHDTWKQGYLNVFYFALERKSYILKIFPEIEQKQMKKYLHSLAYKFTLGVIDELSENMSVNDEDKRFIADTYAHALVGVLVSWVNDGMKSDPELIVKKFGILSEGIISTALSKFQSKND